MSDTQAFATLDLPPAQIDNLTQLGYKAMTPIQAQSLPPAMAGEDLIAKAKTGSGKTAAFAIPMLLKINPRFFGVQGLVLCPTRELATQVANEMRRLARYQQNIKVVVLCGGQSIGPQIGSLEHGAHIVVGTPGRIKDHLRKETLDLSSVSTLVLDEADRMLDMGFAEDITHIIETTPSKRQTLLFSATYPDTIGKLSARFQKNAKTISVEAVHQNQQIEQVFFELAGHSEKPAATVSLLLHYEPTSCVIFCNTKQQCINLRAYLRGEGFSTLALQGDMEQRDRDQVLVQFANGSSQILIATDVAARGLDIDDLSVVINYDLSREAATYIHRIGRTGRAGKSGLALSLVAASEGRKVAAIESVSEQKITTRAIKTIPHSHNEAPRPEMVTLCIAGGRKDKVRPGDLLGALTGKGGIEGNEVGKINIFDFSSYVAIKRQASRQAFNCLQNGKIKNRKFKVRKL